MKGEIPTSLDSHNDPFGVISPTPQAKLSHDSLESVFGDHEDEELEFPGFIDTAFFCVTQKNRLRRSCLSTITSPWFERLVIFVILLNCLTLGMYQPCLDADGCSTTRCYVLGVFDHVIYAFFLIEMTVKVIAMGFWGKKAYCDEAWNRLDFFIIVAGAAEYGLGSDGNINLSAIRTIRVLRPLRAINRIPNLRILVMLLLDTMPMLANVLLICFFVFFIFGILGVQLWAGMLRQRCFMTADMEQLLENVTQQFNISNPVKKYYKGEWSNLEFICSKPTELGMLTCKDIPILVKGEFQCGLSFSPSTYDYILSNFTPPDNYSCINWNQYYTECREGGPNPFGEAISFDNIASAWIAIFQVISLEGWVDIMYYMQDAHSYWVWVYFLALIVIGAFFMVNLFLVVIATQFSETKRRETEKIAEERKRYKSSTTLTSTETEAEGCYNQLLKYIIHVIKKNLRKLKIHFQEWRRVGKNQNQGELDAKNIELNIFADHIHCRPCTHMMAVVERRNIPLASPEISDIESGLHQSTHQSIRRLSHKLSRRSSRSSEPSVIRIRRQSPAGSITEHTISAKSSSKHINTAGLQVIVDASYCHNNTALITILPNHPRLQATRSLGSKPTSTSPRRPLHSSQRLSRIETSRLTPPCNGNVLRRTRSNDTRPHRSGLLTVPNRALDPVKLSQQPHLKGDPYLQSDQSSSKANHCEDTKLLKPRTHLSPEIYATGIPLSRHSSSSTLHKSSRNSTHVTPDRDSDRQSFSLLSYMGGECDMNCAVCQHHCENHKLEEALDQKEMSICTKIQVKISNFRRRVKHHVDGKLFRFGVLAAILINTVMMGIEHHDQPAQLTHFTEVSNFVFIGIFTLEMILKLTADGFLVYIKDSLCVFDGFIVIMSYVELGMGAENSGLSVLRTFRLLRILKLIRFLPALQRQFLVMVKTLDNVASFFGLLMLFMFIFSVLGMNLFGCLFFELDEDGERVASRRNFDSLLWSMITVFQVLTQEDWNLIMYEGMKFTTPWAALYFIALMTIGNYVLFNLLVAILVEGFSSVAQDLLVKKILTELEQSRYLLELPCDLCGEAPTCVGPLAINANLQRIESIKIESDMGDQQLKDGSEEGSDACNRYSVTDGQELGPLITRTDATPHGSLRSDLSRLLPTPRFTIDEPKISDNTNSHIEEWNPFVNLSKSDRDKSSACSVSSGRSRRSSKSAHSDERVRMLEDQDDHRDEEKPSLSTNSSSNYSSLKNLNLPLLFQCASSENLSTPICASPKKSNGGPVHLETKDNKEADSNGGVRKAEEHTPLIDGSDEGKKNDEQSQVKSRQRKNILFKQDTVKEMTPKKKPGGVKQEHQFEDHEKMFPYSDMQRAETQSPSIKKRSLYQKICHIFRPRGCFRTRADYSFYIFSPTNPVRVFCTSITTKKWFDYSVLVLIGLNCIALAVERPSIPPDSLERTILTYANYGFTLLFLLEMILKVITHGLVMGSNSYLRNGWNVNDGFLVAVSVVDLIISWWSALSRPKIFGVLRVLRLLRALRPLRVISRAPGLKLVVETLLSSLRPIGNIVLICITFFLIFGILGVQLFKGTFWHCVGEHIKNITTKAGCQANPANQWVNEKYNFDHLGSALMSLFVLSSKDGWVMIMYTGLDAVGVDKQPIQNHSEWRLLYFISFLLLVGFFVLNMFVGVVVENFHRCREVHEKQERERKEQKRLKKLARKIAKRDLAQGLTLGIQAMGVTNGVTETPSYNVNEDYKDSEETVEMNEPPYWMSYGPSRYKLYQLVVNKYFDISVAIIIFLNVISMAVEHYNMSEEMEFALKMLNYVFTFIFILEALLKVVALGFLRYIRERWNQLDVLIVFLSILGIVMEEIETGAMPINPTIIRVMRILRIARVLKLLKMATGIRALLDTVLVALPQVGNLGLLFFLLFFIFAALGVELFGKIECSNANPCEGMGIHANFENSGAAFLTLFRIATGDNWNGIMKDALREDCDKSEECVRNCCVNRVVTPIYFVVFVLTAQFVLVNVVVAVLMKHLEDANFSVEDILYERRIDVTGTEGQHLLHQLALTQSARNLSTLVEPAETLRQIHYSDTVPDRLNKERSPHIMDQNGRAIHGSRRAHRRQNSLPNNFKLSSFYDDT